MSETRSKKIKLFILENIPSHSRDIVAVTAAEFAVTRTTVHRHLNNLLKNGKVYKVGITNNIVYTLQSSLFRRFDFPLTKHLSESDIWAKNYKFLKDELPENIYAICEYGFTEMLNNAKDHSQGSQVHIESDIENGRIKFRIFDNGVGVFKKLKDAFGYTDERESILQLSKGKLTTDPKNHSGEGIFFSSRVFDSFVIVANGFAYVRDHKEDDWFFERRESTPTKGTLFEMEITIATDSMRNLSSVFKKYTDPTTRAFDKTQILVNLSLSNEDRFVSRSQAKRILIGLEKFKHIILDFKGIQSVGQAFVDEVFRVFQNDHVEIKISAINENDDVKFMVERGIATAKR